MFRDHDDTPDNLWQSCKQCGEMIFHRDLSLLQQVCPGCDHHMRVGARERFTQIFDDGVFEKVDVPDVPHDPLKFKDKKRYTDRLRDARNKTGDRDAVQVALGTIQGRKSVI
ncbi:MAG: acetyl-CoA carboxylase carboxyl transferase subunit beta, partial [Pseudomonadota bacterium]|nr:acetyl-CoA carboxylase carboxyl transferase subunit beta [Pseudomonadota bacterium]